MNSIILSTSIILAIGFLVSLAVNALHWGGRNGERFLHPPQSGFLRTVFAIWTLAPISTAILSLADMIPNTLFPGVAVSLNIALVMYSVARRHQDRGNT